MDSTPKNGGKSEPPSGLMAPSVEEARKEAGLVAAETAEVKPATLPTDTQSVDSNGPAADDTGFNDDQEDLERGWINKAKHIVNSTKDDPYTRSEKLTELRADYLKQRYNKIIKLDK